jgi:hypothetical protein
MLAVLFKRLFAVANFVSVLAWLFSLGFGAVVSSTLANFVSLDEPWRFLFFLGLFFMAAALSVPFALTLFSWLHGHVVRLNAHGTQVRQALVAVRGELLEVQDLMKKALASGKFPPPYDADHRILFPQGAWTNNSASLAGNVALTKSYDLVQEAYRAIGHVNAEVRHGIPALREDAVDFRLDVALQDEKEIETALERLAPATKELNRMRERV